jgi:hypothetical protein
VRSASGDDGRKLFQHVGHRGPVNKGLGAMNPCDNLRPAWTVIIQGLQVTAWMVEARFLAGAMVCFTSLLLTACVFHSATFWVNTENLFSTAKMTGFWSLPLEVSLLLTAPVCRHYAHCKIAFFFKPEEALCVQVSETSTVTYKNPA